MHERTHDPPSWPIELMCGIRRTNRFGLNLSCLLFGVCICMILCGLEISWAKIARRAHVANSVLNNRCGVIGSTMILARIPGRARSKLMRNECDPRSRRGYSWVRCGVVEKKKQVNRAKGRCLHIAKRSVSIFSSLLPLLLAHILHFEMQTVKEKNKSRKKNNISSTMAEPKTKGHWSCTSCRDLRSQKWSISSGKQICLRLSAKRDNRRSTKRTISIRSLTYTIFWNLAQEWISFHDSFEPRWKYIDRSPAIRNLVHGAMKLLTRITLLGRLPHPSIDGVQIWHDHPYIWL